MPINGYVKPKNQDTGPGLSQLLGIAGGVVGSIVPGVGTGVGMAAGSAIGGAMDASKPKEVAQPPQPTGIQPQQPDNVMANRLNAAMNDPGVKIADAAAALPKLSPELQQEYGPALSQASKLAMSRRA